MDTASARESAQRQNANATQGGKEILVHAKLMHRMVQQTKKNVETPSALKYKPITQF